MAVSVEFGTVPYSVLGALDPNTEPDPVEIGRYRIIERIGVGGAAVVYAGIDGAGEVIAIKTLRTQVAADFAHRARFAQEVTLLSRIEESFTTALLDADVQADRPWLAMRYISGPTLSELVDTDGPMRGETLLEFVSGLAQALVIIHQAGIVHRDLKPDNVIVSERGPCVLDFGIALAIEEPVTLGTGEILGSPGWISPEQLRECVPGASADVFAWGGLAAYASTGRRPFGTGTVRDTAERILNGLADLRGTPHNLRPLVEAALDTDPDRRPSSIELAAAIEALRHIGLGR